MPIYEYVAIGPKKGCDHCRSSFELIQGIRESPCTNCPRCGGPVSRKISLARTQVPGAASGKDRVERKVAEYERQGMFSHAAELADKASEKSNRAHLKERAMENYKKAGYDL
jgi:putative FmdB family regulatory protein